MNGTAPLALGSCSDSVYRTWVNSLLQGDGLLNAEL